MCTNYSCYNNKKIIYRKGDEKMLDHDYKEVLSYMYEGVYVVDKERRIIFWNYGSEQITGYSSEEVLNKFCYDNILQHVNESGDQLCFGGCPLHHTLDTGEISETDVFLHHKDGHRVPVTVKAIPVYDKQRNIVAAIEVFTDTRYKKVTYDENRRLKELLTIDELTGISNRRHLDFHLNNLINEATEFELNFGILFIDIDNFKNVNDTYGHNIGDEILKLVSQTLRLNIRSDDKIGRWGGEEFIAVLRLPNQNELLRMAEKLRLLVSESFYTLDNKEKLSVTISVGGTMLNYGEDISKIVSRADNNMYISKKTGKNKVTIK